MVRKARRVLLMLGPAFVAAVAYVDPGNFAANFSAGAEYGYALLWVLVVANLMASLVQYLSAKVGTVICFRTGNPRDEQLLLPMFAPYIEQAEINNLPAFNFYAKLSAIRPQEPMSGQTLLLQDVGNEELASRAIALSRQTFAKKKVAGDLNHSAHTIQQNFHSKGNKNPIPTSGSIELIDA